MGIVKPPFESLKGSIKPGQLHAPTEPAARRQLSDPETDGFIFVPQFDNDNDDMDEGRLRMDTQLTRQLLVKLPDELARRLKRQVPARRRSAFVQHLLEQALAPDGGDNDPLYQAALAVEQDERLAAEMAAWDGTVADGLGADVSAAQHG